MKYKKLMIIISIIATVILLLLFGNLFVYIFLPEPTVIQSVQSPDGMYTAYIYESNGGATTGFIYHLSVLEKGTTLSKGKGNTYISGFEFDIEWINDRELQVNNTSSIRIYKQREIVKGVKINYKYLR